MVLATVRQHLAGIWGTHKAVPSQAQSEVQQGRTEPVVIPGEQGETLSYTTLLESFFWPHFTDKKTEAHSLACGSTMDGEWQSWPSQILAPFLCPPKKEFGEHLSQVL